MALLVFSQVGCDNCVVPARAPQKVVLAPGVQAPVEHDKGLSNKKKEFIDFLYPHILQANAEVKKERDQLFALHAAFAETWTLTQVDEQWLQTLAANYKMLAFDARNEAHWSELKKRVDIVPAPLAIAQAASESGWGTSRFAVEGNNFFGQWCFTFSCGIVPKLRSKGAKHEVKRFASAYESVFAYIRNLNSNHAYHKVRDLRAQMRDEGKTPVGHALASGLEKYSSRGKAYVQEVRVLIKRNRLENYRSLPTSA